MLPAARSSIVNKVLLIRAMGRHINWPFVISFIIPYTSEPEEANTKQSHLYKMT